MFFISLGVPGNMVLHTTEPAELTLNTDAACILPASSFIF